MTNGDQEALTQKALYFLRVTERESAVNMGDVDGDILCGEIHPNTLQ